MKFVYRAGYPATGTPVFHRRWLRIGPYVIGDLDAWDNSDAA